MVDNNIIQKGKNHIAGESSSELRINPNLVSDLVAVEITKHTLIKSINKFHDVSRYYKTNSYITENTIKYKHIIYPYLDNHFNEKLKIDKVSAYNYLDVFKIEQKEIIQKFKTKETRTKHGISLVNKINRFKYQIEYINDGNFYNRVDDNVGRYNSILTNIKSELRKYITYDNQRLHVIDVVSSQPYFSISLLDDKLFEQNKMGQRIRKFWKQKNVCKGEVCNNNNIINNNQSEIDNNIIMIRNFIKENQNTKDVLEYKNLILSGLFYERFAEYILAEYPNKVFKDEEEKRKYSKMALLKTIFADEKIEKYGEYIPVFKKHFPTLYELFHLIKFNGSQHHILACILQNLEAEILLDKTCGELSNNYPDIILYTIHDSIITTNEYIEPVKDALYRNLYNVVGEYPNFKLECWEEKETDKENK